MMPLRRSPVRILAVTTNTVPQRYENMISSSWQLLYLFINSSCTGQTQSHVCVAGGGGGAMINIQFINICP